MCFFKVLLSTEFLYIQIDLEIDRLCDEFEQSWKSGAAPEICGYVERVSTVSFSSDGSRIASGSDDGTIKLWDAATGEELRTLKGHEQRVSSVVFSPDDTRLTSKLQEDLAEYSASAPMPTQRGGLADGRLFIRWLAQKQTLPDEVRIGAARFDVQFTVSSSGIRPRRWPSCRVLFVSEPRRDVLFLHLAAGRLFSWGIPMGRH